MATSLNYFAVTFRGLEDLLAEELRELPTVSITQLQYRRVYFRSAYDPQLTGLTCCDDLFLEVAQWSGITRDRANISRMQDLLSHINLTDAIGHIRQYRPIPNDYTISVTVNHVGKRNYTSAEIKSVAGLHLAPHYVENDSLADLNLRIFIEGDAASVGLRLTAQPLYRRSYTTRSPGSPAKLKPPVAAAMLRMAKVTDAFLDPFCGNGTLLSEGKIRGLDGSGGDIIRSLSRLSIAQWDARALPLATSTVDRVVSNLPWDIQIPIKAGAEDFYASVSRELERVLRPTGKMVLLTTTPEMLQFSQLREVASIEISLFGQRPRIVQYEH